LEFVIWNLKFVVWELVPVKVTPIKGYTTWIKTTPIKGYTTDKKEKRVV